MKKTYLILGFAFTLCAVLPFSSCKEDKDDIEESEIQDPKQTEKEKKLAANRYYMRRYYEDYFPYYFWYDDVVQDVRTLSYDKFSTIESYFYATLFKEDRWSWMMTADEYLSDEAGEQTGTYGVSIGQSIEYYDDYSIRIRYIYPGSPFERHGVTRGWILTHINSIPVMKYIAEGTFYSEYLKDNQTYTFKDTNGESHTFTTSPLESLSTRSSLKAEVFEPGDYPGLTEPVGYFLYMSYKAGFMDDIDNAFELFKAAGVKKFILDLRYNGGGDGRASNLLVSYLAPDSADNKVYRRTIHNRELTFLNSNDTIHRKANSLDLDELYVIGGSGTASASEVTINGLKPYLNLYLVGDTTYGKPNGMYVLYYPGEDEDYARYDANDFSGLKLVYLPIAFFSKNCLDESIPYKGFIPDNYRPDDLRHDFGVEEDNIKACLEHIVSGEFPELPKLLSVQTRGTTTERNLVFPDDLRTSSLYGRTILPLPKELRK
ncbi:MAG: hypothetical protein J6T18_10655 [Bacteroidaceae bacterium]|nr:hypothetical protein [Bacteroidaceae bacterium]